MIPVILSIESLSNTEMTLQCTNNSIPTTTTYSDHMGLTSNKNYTKFTDSGSGLCFQQGIQYRVTLIYSPQSLSTGWLLDSVSFNYIYSI